MTPGSPSKKKSLALIGMRGAGKTTVARQLAELLRAEYVDTDERIQRDTGKTIAEIFSDEGEAGFRRRERQTVLSLAQNPPTVISLGGGAILDSKSRIAIAGVAHVVYLQATAEKLCERISKDESSATTRPALTGYEGVKEVEAFLKDRDSTYRKAADLVINTTDQSPQEVAASIVAHFGLTPC